MARIEAKEAKSDQRRTLIKPLNVFLVIGATLVIILIPILLNTLLFSNDGADWVQKSVSNGWVGYVGTYLSSILGGIISGGLTLIGVRQTILHSERLHEELILREQKDDLISAINVCGEISTFIETTQNLIEHTDDDDELSGNLDETREVLEKLKIKCVAAKDLLLHYGLEDVLSAINLFQNLHDAPGYSSDKGKLLDQVIKLKFMNEFRREQIEKGIQKLNKLDPDYFNAVKSFTRRGL